MAEFTHQIAKALDSLDRLGAVITPQRQTQSLPYPVQAPEPPLEFEEGSNYPLTRELWAAWMWGALFRSGFFLSVRHLQGTQPVLFLTYVDVLFAPALLQFCQATGVRLWVLFHGVEIMELQESHPDLLTEIHARAERFFFNSKATRRLFIEKTGREPQPNHILHPAIDFEKLKSLSPEPLSLDISEDITIFSSVCRLVERKGLDRSVRAFREMKEDGALEDAVYVVAGTGPEEERLRRIAGGEEGRSILFPGYVSDAEKKYLLMRSVAFLHPNYSRREKDFEGFGISLVEAAWFGCAVLGGDQGGVPEAIGELSNCDVVSTEEEKQAVNNIKSFLSKQPREKEEDIKTKEVNEYLRELKMTEQFGVVFQKTKN